MNKPLSIEELKKRIKPVRNVREQHQEGMTGLERLAVVITEHVGTMGFFFIIVTWTIFWLGWNFLAPKNLQFDPPMAFVFWLFISNMVQIFLMPLIMIGQNIQGRYADMRAENDYAVNVKAEQEVEAILHHLEFQNNLILLMLEKLGIDIAQVKGMEQSDKPSPSQ